MPLSMFVDVLRAGLFALAHAFGGSFGAAIVVLAIALRVVLLPLTIRATTRRLVRDAKLRALQPELATLKRRHARRPTALGPAVERLYQKHGVRLVDSAALVDSLLQLVPAASLYAAIRGLPKAGRFLWMADLVTPDRALASVAALVSAGIAWAAAASGEGGRTAQLAPILVALVTFGILSHVSAGVALYSFTNSVIGGAEQAMARRMLRPEAP
jgi:YidC/Oxa1 family membrane protein insertase